MRRFRILATLAALCLPTVTLAQKPAPEDKTGLAVGATAPMFELKDQNGKLRSFDELRGESEYVAIVFYRSASW